MNFCDRILSEEGVSPWAHFFKTRLQVRDSKSITDLRRYPLSPAASGLPLARGPSRPHTTSRVSLGGRRRIAHVRSARLTPRSRRSPTRVSRRRSRIPRSKRTERPSPRPARQDGGRPAPRRASRQPHAVKESERDWHDRTVLMAERSASPIAPARSPLARRTTESLKPWMRRPASHVPLALSPPRASSRSLPFPRVSQSARRTSGSTAIAPVFLAVR